MRDDVKGVGHHSREEKRLSIIINKSDECPITHFAVRRTATMMMKANIPRCALQGRATASRRGQ
jgi:hypothetical protein